MSYRCSGWDPFLSSRKLLESKAPWMLVNSTVLNPWSDSNFQKQCRHDLYFTQEATFISKCFNDDQFWLLARENTIPLQFLFAQCNLYSAFCNCLQIISIDNSILILVIEYWMWHLTLLAKGTCNGDNKVVTLQWHLLEEVCSRCKPFQSFPFYLSQQRNLN